MNNEQKTALLNETAIIVPHSDDESMRVDHITNNELYCTGEESGEQYAIGLDDFDVNEYMFYTLAPLDVDKFKV